MKDFVELNNSASKMGWYKNTCQEEYRIGRQGMIMYSLHLQVVLQHAEAAGL